MESRRVLQGWTLCIWCRLWLLVFMLRSILIQAIDDNILSLDSYVEIVSNLCLSVSPYDFAVEELIQRKRKREREQVRRVSIGGKNVILIWTSVSLPQMHKIHFLPGLSTFSYISSTEFGDFDTFFTIVYKGYCGELPKENSLRSSWFDKFYSGMVKCRKFCDT